jgi:hypothetical protein
MSDFPSFGICRIVLLCWLVASAAANAAPKSTAASRLDLFFIASSFQ